MPRTQDKALAASLCRGSEQHPPHDAIECAGGLLCVEFLRWSDIYAGFGGTDTEAYNLSRIIANVTFRADQAVWQRPACLLLKLLIYK